MEFCFECGLPAVEQHHVIPRSAGGTKTVPLCSSCHGRVHGMRRMHISELTKAGLQRARSNGVRLGGPTKFSPKVVQRVLALHEQGFTCREITTKTGVSPSRVSQLCRAHKEAA